MPVHLVRVVPLSPTLLCGSYKMQIRRQDMSLEQRQLVVDFYRHGEKQNKLAEIFSVNKSTIRRLIKKFQKEENLENSSNRGRNKMMDERGDRLLIRSIKKNRRQTLNEISADYNNHASQKVSTRTIQRRLHFYGFQT